MSEDRSPEELRRALRDAESTTRAAEALRKEAERKSWKLAAIAAGLAVAILTIGGHWWPGYQLDSVAALSATQAEANGRIAVLAAVCVTKARADTDPSKLAMVQQAGSYQRAAEMAKTGWVEFPTLGLSLSTRETRNVAEKCGEILLEKKPA